MRVTESKNFNDMVNGIRVALDKSLTSTSMNQQEIMRRCVAQVIVTTYKDLLPLATEKDIVAYMCQRFKFSRGEAISYYHEFIKTE